MGHLNKKETYKYEYNQQQTKHCIFVIFVVALSVGDAFLICQCTLYTVNCTLYTDMQFVTNFTRIKFQNNCIPKKRINYDKLRFPTKQRKLNFYIIIIHTQGYITFNKYIIGIATIATIATIAR